AFFGTEGGLRSFDAEPRTEFAVGSARQDFRGGASQIGVLGTVLHRDLPAGGALGYLTTQAYNGGVRFDHQWMQRGWRLTGFLAGSHVRGAPEAPIAIQ